MNLEHRVIEIEKAVLSIIDNHLPHVNTRLDFHEKLLFVILATVLSIAGAILVGVLLLVIQAIL